MKSLSESLFDKDLVQKDVKRIPGTIGWRWDYDHCIAIQRTDNTKIYKLFNKQYIKKHQPTKDELDQLIYSLHPYSDDLKYFKIQTAMAYTILTWSDQIIPKGKFGTMFVHISKTNTPGISVEDTNIMNNRIEVRYTRTDKLEISVYSQTKFITFYFRKRD